MSSSGFSTFGAMELMGAGAARTSLRARDCDSQMVKQQRDAGAGAWEGVTRWGMRCEEKSTSRLFSGAISTAGLGQGYTLIMPPCDGSHLQSRCANNFIHLAELALRLTAQYGMQQHMGLYTASRRAILGNRAPSSAERSWAAHALWVEVEH